MIFMPFSQFVAIWLIRKAHFVVLQVASTLESICGHLADKGSALIFIVLRVVTVLNTLKKTRSFGIKL